LNKYLNNNLKLWNEITPIHNQSDFYDVDGFKNGRNTLKPIELEELGDVSGKSLLHLQCHFGMDTLSWARLGAKVTGVDFSDKAIFLARSLSKELKIQADFICSDIYQLPGVLSKKFDIVFTSYGVLCWLPDINWWAQIISRFLKQGGIFYIVESHPVINIFDNSKNATELKVIQSYFHKPEPIKWEPEGDYTDKNAKVSNPSYEWTHNLSDIINALINSGLKIEFLHEFSFSNMAKHFPFMEQDQDRLWRVPGDKIPLTFSLKAKRPR
jgi:SAM-dependent methyltransferase